MEFLPRISRSQSMDVLSSQANLSGYKAVILAAERCPKMFPMMITAAGTLKPAKVFIIGVGVAGLQAIATAKRLGAMVEAYDVRPATKEQVQSLGARFVELPVAAADAETAGGYAREQTDEERQKQTELMAKHVIGADVVITTAAVFGKAPPMLIPADVVKQMSHGSMIVDLAADPKHGRGNCELTKPGEIVTTENGAIIIGQLNLPATVPVHASQVYANNINALLKEVVKDGAIVIDLADDVQKGAVITHDGQIVNEMVAKAMN
jgi:NAD(P) transhydrogenase subunit alpha